MNFKVTDWTRPADLEWIFFWRRWDNLKPVILSIILLVSWLATKFISIVLGFSRARIMAGLVISWNSKRSVFATSSFKTSAKCQAIASPSRSGSVANITFSERVAYFFNSFTISVLSLETIYVGLKLLFTSTPNPPGPDVLKSLIWPTEAITL